MLISCKNITNLLQFLSRNTPPSTFDLHLLGFHNISKKKSWLRFLLKLKPAPKPVSQNTLCLVISGKTGGPAERCLWCRPVLSESWCCLATRLLLRQHNTVYAASFLLLQRGISLDCHTLTPLDLEELLQVAIISSLTPILPPVETKALPNLPNHLGSL